MITKQDLNQLEEWLYDLNRAERRDIDNSCCTSPEFYTLGYAACDEQFKQMFKLMEKLREQLGVE